MTASPETKDASLIQVLREAFLNELEAVIAPAQPALLQAVRDAAGKHHDVLARLENRMGFEQASGLTASRISLVHEDDLVFTLELIDLARKLRERCGAELAALHGRYAILLARSDLAPDMLPIGPETVCQALRVLAEAQNLSSAQRSQMIDDLASPLADGLAHCYAQLNAKLVEAGVQPHQPARPRRAQPLAPVAAPAPAPAEDPAAALQQQLSMRRPDHGTTPTTLDPTLAAAIVGQIREWLVRRQGIDGADAPLSGSDLAHLLPAELAGAVETVEQVFTLIATHPDLPARIKPVLAGLKGPLLLQVLDQPQTIGDPAQPARQLIDGIATLGMRLPADRRGDGAYEALVAIVSGVQHDPPPDEKRFARALHQLQGLATSHAANSEQKTSPFIDDAIRLDRREHALDVASRALARMIESGTPAPIHDFLWTWWVQVLARTLYRLGDKHPRWREQLTATHQLVLSGRSIHAPQERTRRMEMLPPLIEQLRTGLAGVGMDTQACERALAACMDLHAAILGGKPTPEPARPGADPLPGRSVDPATGLGLLGIGLVLREAGRTATEPLPLTTDSLLEISLPGNEAIRASVSWIGPQHQVALLYCHTDDQVLAASLKALGRLVAAKQARLLHDRNIVGQAATQLLRHAGA